MKIPEQAEYILNILMEHGYEAYVVGGCVRDMLLSREPEDWDITTSACPEQVKAFFHRTIDTGIRHGTVTVMINRLGYEVTTYRIDGEYEDSRHPKEVAFTKELAEDLRRRDFTINAMAYNHKNGLVDLFQGQEDLKNGLIRCVGNPEERFREDALRIMRAVRFAGQLGFAIEEQTLAAAHALSGNLKYISAERVRTELTKLLVSPHPELLLTAYEQGITKVILPEFDCMMETEQNNPHHCFSVGRHCIQVLCEVQRQWKGLRDGKTYQCLCLAALLHDVGKPLTKTTDQQGIDHFYGHPAKSEHMTDAILKRLKFDNETITMVRRLVKWHDYGYASDKRGMRRAVNKIGQDLMELLFVLQTCDVLGQNRDKRDEKLELLEKAQKYFYEIREEGQCTSLKMLAINGTDLMAAGYPAGKGIGVILHELLEHVLEVPEDNEKQILLAIAQDKYRI